MAVRSLLEELFHPHRGTGGAGHLSDAADETVVGETPDGFVEASGIRDRVGEFAPRLHSWVSREQNGEQSAVGGVGGVHRAIVHEHMFDLLGPVADLGAPVAERVPGWIGRSAGSSSAQHGDRIAQRVQAVAVSRRAENAHDLEAPLARQGGEQLGRHRRAPTRAARRHAAIATVGVMDRDDPAGSQHRRPRWPTPAGTEAISAAAALPVVFDPAAVRSHRVGAGDRPRFLGSSRPGRRGPITAGGNRRR
jgi:hypothetical protein